MNPPILAKKHKKETARRALQIRSPRFNRIHAKQYYAKPTDQYHTALHCTGGVMYARGRKKVRRRSLTFGCRLSQAAAAPSVSFRHGRRDPWPPQLGPAGGRIPNSACVKCFYLVMIAYIRDILGFLVCESPLRQPATVHTTFWWKIPIYIPEEQHGRAKNLHGNRATP